MQENSIKKQGNLIYFPKKNYICSMPLKMTTYYRGKDIPDLPGRNTFHSKELFLIYEATPGYSPVFIVASEQGKPVAKLLAGIRTKFKLFPPSIFKRCEIYGIGEFLTENLDKEAVFREMLEHLTTEVLRNAFLIEFRNLESPMFGYKSFRDNHYFPINWLRVRNSLHSCNQAESRISPSRLRQIRKGLANGATLKEAQTPEEINNFARMLLRVYRTRIRKHFPDIRFFMHLEQILLHTEKAKVYLVLNKEKRIIGGSVCIFSGENAYLWFSGGMTKTYATLYPGVLAVWAALKNAFDLGYQHLEFMDVGLPFRKHGYRHFVLRFGGKQSSTRRWYRVRWKWLNKLLIKIYV